MRISELGQMVTLTDDTEFIVVDTQTNATKKITADNLRRNLTEEIWLNLAIDGGSPAEDFNTTLSGGDAIGYN